MIKKLLILYFIFFVQLKLDATSTGASFLKIGVGARPIGLGSAFTAIANDVTAIHWNPAGLAQLRQNQFSAMHNEWIVDTSMDFIGFAVPIKSPYYSPFNKGGNYKGDYVIGGSILYLNHGELEGRDTNRQNTGTFGASDLAVTFSYSKFVGAAFMTPAGLINQTPTISYGINLKLIRQQIELEQATGVAMDIGLLIKVGSINRTPTVGATFMTPVIGLAIQNIGPQMKFISEGYNLPLTITCGVGYNIGGLTIAMDIKNQIYEGRTIVSVGTEYLPVSIISLRAGYLSQLFNNNRPDKSGRYNYDGLGMGLGLKILSVQTDYSFVPYGELGDTHHISFSSQF